MIKWSRRTIRSGNRVVSVWYDSVNRICRTHEIVTCQYRIEKRSDGKWITERVDERSGCLYVPLKLAGECVFSTLKKAKQAFDGAGL